MNDFAAATPDYPPLPPSLPSSTINNNNPLTFDDYHCRTESKPPQALDHGVGYAGFGYDHLQLTSPDPYADKTNSTQWPEVDFHQDFYGDVSYNDNIILLYFVSIVFRKHNFNIKK